MTDGSSSSWLTAKRLRAHATILAVCIWGIYVWTLATPGLRDRNGNLKGTDFLHLYTLGSLAAAHRGADLYEMNAQSELAAQRVPEAAGLRYLPLYPPQVSILFVPLAHLSYGWALAIWWIFSAAIYGICCYAIWHTCPYLQDHGGTVLILAVAYPAFFHLIAWGQTSAIALACFTAMFFLLRARLEFAAGMILGCLIFKPQLGVAAAVVFLLLGAWKIVFGAILSATGQLGLGVLHYGIGPLREWMLTLIQVPEFVPWLEPKPYQTHSLRTFWSMLLFPYPGFALVFYIVSAVIVLGLTVAVWRRRPSEPLALRYSALLLATVLVAPHLTVYDLVILSPVFLLLADWMAGQADNSSRKWLGILLSLVYVLPLLGPLTQWTHVQLSVIAMTATIFILWRTNHKVEPRASDPEKKLQSFGEAPRPG